MASFRFEDPPPHTHTLKVLPHSILHNTSLTVRPCKEEHGAVISAMSHSMDAPYPGSIPLL